MHKLSFYVGLVLDHLAFVLNGLTFLWWVYNEFRET